MGGKTSKPKATEDDDEPPKDPKECWAIPPPASKGKAESTAASEPEPESQLDSSSIGGESNDKLDGRAKRGHLDPAKADMERSSSSRSQPGLRSDASDQFAESRKSGRTEDTLQGRRGAPRAEAGLGGPITRTTSRGSNVPESERGSFQPGQTVQIHSLQHAVELNGQEGVLRFYDGTAKRWVIRLHSGIEKGIRANNMTPVGQASAGASAGSSAAPASSNNAYQAKRSDPATAADKGNQELEAVLLQTNWSTIYQIFHQRYQVAKLDQIGGSYIVKSAVEMTLSIASKCFALLRSDPSGRLHCTPLHIAALQSSTEACEVIIRDRPQLVAQTHKQSASALCPLHIAILSGALGVVELLLEGQANPNVRTLHDVCPLHLAATTSKEMCEVLLAFSADPFKRDVMGCSCLHYAVTFKQILVMDYLLSHSQQQKRLACDPDQKRVTPLHIGCALYISEEDYPGLMLLMASGAKPLANDVSGTAARDLVPWYRHSHVQKFFETCGDRVQEGAQEYVDQWRKQKEQEEQTQQKEEEDGDRSPHHNSDSASVAGTTERSSKKDHSRRRHSTDAEEVARLKAAAEEGAKMKNEIDQLKVELEQSKDKCRILEQASTHQKQSLEDMQKLCDAAHSQRQWQLEEVQRQQLEERKDWEARVQSAVEAAKSEASQEISQKLANVESQKRQAEQELETLRLEAEHQQEELKAQLAAAKQESRDAMQETAGAEEFKDARRKSVVKLQKSLSRTGVGGGGGGGGAGASDGGQVTELTEEVSRLQALYRMEQSRHMHCRNQLQDIKGAVRVFCRLLPCQEKESEVEVARRVDAFTVELSEPKAREFEFDGVFDTDTSLDEVFVECRDLVRSAMDGQVATMLAYGQSSGGRERAMFGSREKAGLGRHSLEELFRVVDKDRDHMEYTVQVMFTEFYQDRLLDLFGDDPKGAGEDNNGVQVSRGDGAGEELVLQGASAEVVSSAREADKLILQALKRRSATRGRDESCSHLILFVTIAGRKGSGEQIQGRLLLCDLAGADLGKDASSAPDVDAVRTSFQALTAVMEALVKGSKQVPYRTHMLPSLLEDSLGGRGKTLILVTCSVSQASAEETFGCLSWGKRAREIKNETPRIAKRPSQKAPVSSQEVQKLQKEIQRLEAEISSKVAEIKTLQEQVQKLQEEASASRSKRSEAEDRCQRLVLEKQELENREKASAITQDTRLRDLEMQYQQDITDAKAEAELSRKQADTAEALRAEAQPTIERLSAQVQSLETQFSEEQALRKKYHNQIQDMKGAIRVICRFRPMIKREIDGGDAVVSRRVDAFSVEVSKARDGKPADKAAPLQFMFDSTFDGTSTQDEVFADCKELVQSTVDGYNVTIFAYGQTGAGKTFTMYGTAEEPGLAPRSIEALFSVIRKEEKKARGNKVFSVKAYMIEVYKQDIIDLLIESKAHKDKKSLDVKRDIGRGMMYVEGVTERKVASPEELNALLAEGEKRRHTAATKMNTASSRSHLLLSIIVECTVKDQDQVIYGKITLCDLAGSERPKKSEVVGDNLKEAIEINKSLSALGDVIEALTKGAKQVPYRNHKLTMLMQDSLGGTAKTLMFVNCSPAMSNTEETLMSLKWASRARQVTNDVKRNADSKEVARLKEVIKMMSAAQHAVDDPSGGAQETLQTGQGLVS